MPGPDELISAEELAGRSICDMNGATCCTVNPDSTLLLQESNDHLTRWIDVDGRSSSTVTQKRIDVRTTRINSATASLSKLNGASKRISFGSAGQPTNTQDNLVGILRGSGQGSCARIGGLKAAKIWEEFRTCLELPRETFTRYTEINPKGVLETSPRFDPRKIQR